MTALATIGEAFSRWIDTVASSIVALLGRLAPPRTIRIVEGESDEFLVHADEQITMSNPNGETIRIAEDRLIGSISTNLTLALAASRVEIVLRPDRFLFRPLELPGRATEFLDGIVRAQIDRLTPWNDAEAVFGWSKPVEVGTDRVVISVAATALTSITRYTRAIESFGAPSIGVFTTLPEPNPDPSAIKVWEEGTRSALETSRIRRVLIIIFMAASIAAAIAIGTGAMIGAAFDAQRDEIARQIDSTRAAAGAAQASALRTVAAAQRTLERRKRDSPSSVMVLEALSQILPDHTYVTELRIEGSKLRLIGITRDAPALIGLMEQSMRFTHATFFAPTTRSPSDPGERFHIEAIIQPLASSRS